MSEFFESSESENIFVSHTRGLRQRNAIIGILIAIIAVLVAILFVKGCDGDDSPSSIPVAVEESGREESESEGPEDTPPEAATEQEDDNTDGEEAVVGPTPLPDDPESQILLGDYAWLDPSRSEATIALQELLEIEADGWYGIGTRAAHIAALEERGLPTSFAATCDLVLGSDLCSLEGDEPMDQAVELLTAGFGEPTSQQEEWLPICGAEHKRIKWGPVVAYFRKMTMQDGVFVDAPSFVSWNVENTWNEDSNSWLSDFPADVAFPQANYIGPNENGDFSEPRNITDIVIPNGEYVTSSLDSLQETLGDIDSEILFNQYVPYELQFVRTTEYVIGAETTQQGTKWIWGTDFWLCE